MKQYSTSVNNEYCNVLLAINDISSKHLYGKNQLMKREGQIQKQFSKKKE